MKKRIVSMILGASMLLSVSAANAAVTIDQMNITSQTYRSYTDADGNTAAVMNTKSLNDMVLAGDWVYMCDKPAAVDGRYPQGTEKYVTAYNTKTGEYFNLEDKATVQKEGVAVSNVTISQSNTAYNYHANGIKERNGYLYVAYNCAAGDQLNHQSNGGYRIYDITNPSAPVDITDTYTYVNGTVRSYSSVPTSLAGPVYNIYPITDNLAVVNRYPGMAIASTADKSNWVELYQDTANKQAAITNCIYDEETKLLYVTKGSDIIVYDLADTSNIVKKGSVSAHAAGSGNSGNIAKGAFNKTDAGWVVVGAGVSLFNINVTDDGVTTEAINYAALSKKQSTTQSYMISGDYVYLCTGTNVNNYFEIHDISDVANGNTARLTNPQTSNYKTLDDGTTNSSTTGGCYGYHLSADGNNIAWYNAYIGPMVYTIGSDLIVPEENGIVYSSDEITSGDISVTTKISNVTFEDKTPYVVTALYNDATLEMEKVDYAPVTVKAGEAVSYPQTITVPASGDYHIETFVFYDLDTILPVETGTQGILD